MDLKEDICSSNYVLKDILKNFCDTLYRMPSINPCEYHTPMISFTAKYPYNDCVLFLSTLFNGNAIIYSIFPPENSNGRTEYRSVQRQYPVTPENCFWRKMR